MIHSPDHYLIQVLDNIFDYQCREILTYSPLQKIANNESCYLGHWNDPFHSNCEDLLGTAFKKGMEEFGEQLLSSRRGWQFLKSSKNDIRTLHRKMLDIVHTLAVQFAEDTNTTSADQVNQVFQQAREKTEQGVSKKDIQEFVTNRIVKIFRDKYKTKRVAKTEITRANRHGKVLAGKESGFTKKKWITTGRGCPQCNGLEGKLVGIDDPFTVLPGGGLRSIILAPPIHPFCNCDVDFVL